MINNHNGIVVGGLFQLINHLQGYYIYSEECGAVPSAAVAQQRVQHVRAVRGRLARDGAHGEQRAAVLAPLVLRLLLHVLRAAL